MTDNTDIDIEKIKIELKEEIVNYLKQGNLFPDNKIPIYISPINVDNENYLTWAAYSTEGINSEFEDNFCRINEINGNKFLYPTQDDLQPCDEFYTNDILELTDLNTIINNTISNKVNMNKEIEEELNSDEIHNKINEKINEYKFTKNKLISEQKTMNNLINISKILNNLNNKVNKNMKNTNNKVNINNDSIDEEKYDYITTNYYFYIIAALIVLIFIIHFTVLYY